MWPRASFVPSPNGISERRQRSTDSSLPFPVRLELVADGGGGSVTPVVPLATMASCDEGPMPLLKRTRGDESAPAASTTAPDGLSEMTERAPEAAMFARTYAPRWDWMVSLSLVLR